MPTGHSTASRLPGRVGLAKVLPECSQTWSLELPSRMEMLSSSVTEELNF